MATFAAAQPVRVALYNVELQRDGPGLLLRDILSKSDPQVEAVADVIAQVGPDVVIVLGFDFDYDLLALSAFADRLGSRGAVYPYRFAMAPNSGVPTGLDLDWDGRLGGPRDAQGFGYFPGQGGMAVLSVFPILDDQAHSLSDLLWRDMPGENLSAPVLRPEQAKVQRLSSVGHWDLPVALPDGRIFRILAYHASPPVFDGPEDRNGRRNHDETALWLRYLDGSVQTQAELQGPFVIAGDANLDLFDGDGRPDALRTLLNHPRLQDPEPASLGGVEAAMQDRGANENQKGDPALDTVDWRDGEGGPGNLRVDYVLPSTDFKVMGSGVFWPARNQAGRALLGGDGNGASRHRLVWVDLELRR